MRAYVNGASTYFHGVSYIHNNFDQECRFFFLEGEAIPQKNTRPVLYGSCGEGGEYLPGIPKWIDGISAIDSWMREISPNSPDGLDQNIVTEVLDRLYDIGIEKDEDAFDDWKNGDLEVVIENTAWYIQNCEGNELLAIRSLKRALTEAE